VSEALKDRDLDDFLWKLQQAVKQIAIAAHHRNKGLMKTAETKLEELVDWYHDDRVFQVRRKMMDEDTRARWNRAVLEQKLRVIELQKKLG
jgi:hypothetical protein